MDERTIALLAEIKELPPHTVTTGLRNPRGVSQRTFRGALLADYAAMKGLVTPATSSAPSVFAATAEDGFVVAVALAEVAETYSQKQVLLAYEQDGEAVQVGVRLVVPGDDLGGRFILGVVDLQLHTIAEGVAVEGETFGLEGEVDRPARFWLPDLDRFERVEVDTETTGAHGSTEVVRARYSGVRLFDLIEDAGPQLDPDAREPFLSKVVLARGREGYTVVVAGGEIEPRFMNGQAIVATHRNGEPLPADEGPFRLVLPFDRAPGRFVARLSSLELRDVRSL
jgi:hypothetical protein